MSTWDTKAVERAQNRQKPLSTPSAPPRPAPSATQATSGAQGAQEMVFAGRVPGNNGTGGLLRMHWTKRQSFGGLCGWRVRAAQLVPMAGPVRLELIRYSTGRQMDYDNLVSTGKALVDALVRNGILPDDNPQVIVERSYTQERAASKAEQRTVIRLIPL